MFNHNNYEERYARVKRYFACLSNDESIRTLIKNLHARGVNESSLKTALKEMLESSGLSSQSDDNKKNSLINRTMQKFLVPNLKKTKMQLLQIVIVEMLIIL